MDEIHMDVAAAVATVARIDSLPILLPLAYEISGMKVALLAHVVEDIWTACAVQDGTEFRVTPNEEWPIGRPLRVEISSASHRVLVHRKDSRGQLSETLAAGPAECCIAAPIVLANGQTFGVLCALDSTAQGDAESRILSVFKRLSALIALQLDQLQLRDREQNSFLDERAVGQLREQFIAVLGHDLRTPLHAITMSSDALTRRLADPWGSAIASRIKENARRMASLIDDVLDFARARLGGGIDVELSDVENINSGLTTVVQELRDAQPGCEIVSSISVSRSVRCDLGRIQQVASNLLSNALTHGQPYSPIKITVRADDSDLVLQVWNAGEPIPEESIGKIFEPFWRRSTSGSRNGLGLGLHICSQIVRAHEGNISVTSNRDTGTLFTARLPLSPLTTVEPVVAISAVA
jgi:signal transduction histidine kinase